jgi:hypothetical protein
MPRAAGNRYWPPSAGFNKIISQWRSHDVQPAVAKVSAVYLPSIWGGAVPALGPPGAWKSIHHRESTNTIDVVLACKHRVFKSVRQGSGWLTWMPWQQL